MRLEALKPAVFLLFLMLFGGGCEEEVVPLLPGDEVFTLYGFLDAASEQQALRVIALGNRLERERPEPIDATVASTDLNTGEEVVWTDSLVAFPSCDYGHVFTAGFEAAHGHRYRVRVERSDGAVATAETTVPPLVEPTPAEAAVLGSRVVRLPVRWPGAPNLNAIVVCYRLQAIQNGEVALEGDVCYDYPAEARERVEGGWEVTIQLFDDAQRLLVDFVRPAGTRVALGSITMSGMVADEAWMPPGGVYDPEVLVEPGTFSNVNGGFGFVGSGYRTEVTWRPSDEAIETVGLRLPIGDAIRNPTEGATEGAAAAFKFYQALPIQTPNPSPAPKCPRCLSVGYACLPLLALLLPPHALLPTGSANALAAGRAAGRAAEHGRRPESVGGTIDRAAGRRAGVAGGAPPGGQAHPDAA